MNQKKTHIVTLLLAGALMGSSTAYAQYNQDIDVEGKYVPEYIPQDRIGVFPQAVRFPMQKSSLAFATDGVNADFAPQAVPIEVTGWKDTHRFSKARGYVDFGLGSWLESTVSAGYRFVQNESTTAGIRLQHNSISLWKPKVSQVMEGVYQRRYDEMLGVYCSHVFADKGRLNAAADYHFGHFNYYGYNPFYFVPDMKAPDAPWQTLNDVSARVEWFSPSHLDDLAYYAKAGVRYFGMRRLFLPGLETGTLLEYTGGRETDVNIAGGISFPITSTSTLGIDLDSHIIAYNKAEGRGEIDKFPASFEYPDSYGTLTLTPYYGYSRDRLGIHVGARIDLMFNAGFPGDRYRTFNIAPDIRVDYNAGPVTMFLHVDGCNSLHTLAAVYGSDYYCFPAIFCTSPTYIPVNSKLGFTFGPFSGFSAGLDLCYNYSQSAGFNGWYPSLMNGPAARHNLGLPFEIDGRKVSYFHDYEQVSDLHGVSFALRASYDTGRYFKVNAEGSYQPQKGTKGFSNGMDRPQWTLRGSMSSNPWKSLMLNLACEYRADRAFPIWAYFDEAVPGAEETTVPDKTIYMYKVKDYFSLNFSASYQITDWMGVWVEADNLTNRRNILCPGMPEPGIRLAAGMNFIF